MILALLLSFQTTTSSAVNFHKPKSTQELADFQTATELLKQLNTPKSTYNTDYDNSLKRAQTKLESVKKDIELMGMYAASQPDNLEQLKEEGGAQFLKSWSEQAVPVKEEIRDITERMQFDKNLGGVGPIDEDPRQQDEHQRKLDVLIRLIKTACYAPTYFSPGARGGHIQQFSYQGVLRSELKQRFDNRRPFPGWRRCERRMARKIINKADGVFSLSDLQYLADRYSPESDRNKPKPQTTNDDAEPRTHQEHENHDERSRPSPSHSSSPSSDMPAAPEPFPAPPDSHGSPHPGPIFHQGQQIDKSKQWPK
jgi:hypothetical protein